MFARELSCQLAERGWKSVLCFQSEPTEEVKRFLDLPNVSINVYAGPTDSTFKAGKGIATDHPPNIVRRFSTFISSALLILIRGLRVSYP